MEHLRKADYLRTPWKNGGGETLQVAISPQGATIDDFDWRISLSAVVSEGAFSSFPGIDRTLCLVTGTKIDLVVDGELTSIGSSPAACRFRGEASCFARLPAGPIIDLNVMTRRERFDQHVVDVGEGGLLRGGERGAWFVAVQDCVLASDGRSTSVPAHDTLRLDPGLCVDLSRGRGWFVAISPIP